mmetsp:Transcript_10718/g.17993  ORF Transcript_10718/g.17993 Transcript_10718/m.17993 type:complete len:88 (+) Transcript_10718:36-299(+)
MEKETKRKQRDEAVKKRIEDTEFGGRKMPKQAYVRVMSDHEKKEKEKRELEERKQFQLQAQKQKELVDRKKEKNLEELKKKKQEQLT